MHHDLWMAIDVDAECWDSNLTWRLDASSKVSFWKTCGPRNEPPATPAIPAILQRLWPRGQFVGVVLFEPRPTEGVALEVMGRLKGLYPSASGLHAPVPVTGWTALATQLDDWGRRFRWHLLACEDALRERHAIAPAYDDRMQAERRWDVGDDEGPTDRFLESLLDRHRVIARPRRVDRGNVLAIDCASPIGEAMLPNLPGRRLVP